MMLTSAPFDDWWHGAYGLDVKVLSPPHVLLALGIISVAAGSRRPHYASSRHPISVRFSPMDFRKAGRYRMFIQIQRAGVPQTASFDFDVRDRIL